MAQVTVEQLAEVVGASVDRLLTQMKDAGLPHSESEQAVSDEDKQTLLAYLKRSHGESNEAPKRITLKRKTLSTLRASGSQGKKTVNVEVRKKRTYVKRDLEEQPDAEAEIVELDEVEAAAAEAVEAPAPVEAVAETAAEPEMVPEEPEVVDVTDPEYLRQQAAKKRMQREADEKADREALLANKREEEARLKQATQPAAAPGSTTAAPGKVARDNKPKRLHEAPKADPERARKTRGRGERTTEHVRGKQRGHNLSLNQIEAAESGTMRRRGGRKKVVSKTHEEHSTHGFEMPTAQRVHQVHHVLHVNVVVHDSGVHVQVA